MQLDDILKIINAFVNLTLISVVFVSPSCNNKQATTSWSNNPQNMKSVSTLWFDPLISLKTVGLWEIQVDGP